MGKRRKRWIWIGVAVFTVVLGFWLWSKPFGPRLLVENYPKVQMGMSQAEVEELLGGPPGNYGRYAGGSTMMTEEGYMSPPGSVERIWCDDNNRFEIYFDAQNQVVGHHKRAGYKQESPLSALLDELRRMLGF